MRSIDNVSDRWSTELTEDTAVLLEDVQWKKLNEKWRAHVKANYREILQSFDSRKLQVIISKLYLRKSTQEIQSHASHDLVAQLCLDFLWFDHTKVDSAIGKWSKEAILLLKWIYNRMLYRNMPLNSEIDANFFVAAYALLKTNFVYDRSDKKMQQLFTEVKEDMFFSELRTEKGMIVNRKHNPAAFMRDIWSKPLPRDLMGKVFYVWTGTRKDERRRTVKSKKHLFWHGSEGNSRSTLNVLYNSWNAAYAILENGAIVCFFDEGKGTGALNGDKWRIFNDPKAHSNGIAVEFAAPWLKRKATFTRWATTRTRTYRDTVEPNQLQIESAWLLVDYLEAKQWVRLNIGTSWAWWAVWSSDHGDTIGRSDEVLQQLRVDQQHISWVNTKVTPIDS